MKYYQDTYKEFPLNHLSDNLNIIIYTAIATYICDNIKVILKHNILWKLEHNIYWNVTWYIHKI